MLQRVFKKVFASPGFIVWAVLSGIALIVIVILLRNFELVSLVFQDTISFWTKLSFFFGLVKSMPVMFGWLETIIIFLTAIAFGINISFLIFYFNHRGKEMGAGIGGILLALFGIGCASCGGLLLTPIFGVALGASLNALPLGGAEFSLIGLGLIIYSLYSFCKKIDNPYIT